MESWNYRTYTVYHGAAFTAELTDEDGNPVLRMYVKEYGRLNIRWIFGLVRTITT